MLKTLILLSFIGVCSGSVVSQDDWSGGGGVAGPVGTWGSFYSSSVSICSSLEGEVVLSPVFQPDLNPVDFSYEGSLYSRPIFTDVNLDGFTDFIYVSVGRDTLYWLENPCSSGNEWAQHFIFAADNIRSFARYPKQGDFSGIAVAYAGYNDLNRAVMLTKWSPDYWFLTELGFLGSENYSANVVVGNVNGTGSDDVLGLKWAYDEVVVWYGAIPGTPELILTPHTPSRAQVEDCDLDGDGDIFLDVSWIPESMLFWNTPGGFVYQGMQDYYSTSVKAVEDLDGDSLCEISFAFASNLQMFRYDHQLGYWAGYEIAANARDPIYSHVDSDGECDIVAVYENEVSLLYNTGGGNGWIETRAVTGIPQWCYLYATDMNGDSDTDFTVFALEGDILWFDWEGRTYPSSGSLVSSWLHLETDTGWDVIGFQSSEPPGTEVTVQVRTGNDPLNPPGWSPELLSGSDIADYCSEEDSLFQYRLNLYSSEPSQTPSVSSVWLEWTSSVSASMHPLGFCFMPRVSPSESPVLVIQTPGRERFRIDVFDLAGRQCLILSGEGESGRQTEVQVPPLPTGVYQARMTIQSGVLQTRFVVIPN
ncbi:MAG TPA: T9SS type A sorting domain-containing protein [Candidatus Sabulitectum sp.]|nr:T9SS type A sorting domain-containing protein [Candidatus Sabulitectum sp.]HPR23066.1 T9SS type A sorting domain-containing protein [Candidatus Sabulitectum sp.]